MTARITRVRQHCDVLDEALHTVHITLQKVTLDRLDEVDTLATSLTTSR